MHTVALLFLAGGIALAADSDADTGRWIRAQGGQFASNTAGRIVAVNLASTWITDVDLDRIGELEGLQKLDLSHTPVTDIGLEHLKGLRNVTDLNLYFAEYITDSGLTNFTGWSKLERLDLHGTKITSKALEHIARLTSLKSLDIAFTAIDDDGFENLASLEKLERLAIGGDRLTGSCLAALNLLPSLVDLDVGGMQWVDSGLWGLPLNDVNLRQIGALTRLRVLSLNGANLTDRGADRPGSPEAIRKDLKNLGLLKGLVNLEVLDLSRTPVTAESLEPLKSLPKLRELRLGMASGIDDRVAAVLGQMKSLKVVYIAGTQLAGSFGEDTNPKMIPRIFILGFALAAWAQIPTSPDHWDKSSVRINVPFLEKAPVIDGNLSEWKYRAFTDGVWDIFRVANSPWYDPARNRLTDHGNEPPPEDDLNARYYMAGPGNSHYPSMSALVSGQVYTGRGAGGPSFDQVLARKIGGQSRFRSLQIGVCRESFGEAIQRNLSWADRDRPLPPEMIPHRLFDRLFGGREQGWINRERSILDSVREETASLEARVGSEDKQRVDEYLTSVRELERSIASLPPQYKAVIEQPPEGGDLKDWPRIAHLQSDLLAHAISGVFR